MPDMKQIHDFAVKWCDKFRDQNINYIDLVDHFMADDCAALGFEMDCGHAFSERYGQAANNHEALNRIIDDVWLMFWMMEKPEACYKCRHVYGLKMSG